LINYDRLILIVIVIVVVTTRRDTPARKGETFWWGGAVKCCPVSVSIRFGDVATLKSEELNRNAMGFKMEIS